MRKVAIIFTAMPSYRRYFIDELRKRIPEVRFLSLQTWMESESSSGDIHKNTHPDDFVIGNFRIKRYKDAPSNELLNNNIANHLKVVHNFIKLNRKYKFDAVVFQISGFSSDAIKLFCILNKIKIILRQDSNIYSYMNKNSKGTGLKKLLNKHIRSKVCAIGSMSPFGDKYFKSIMKNPSLFHMPIWPSLDKFRYSIDKNFLSKVKSRYNLDLNKKKILWCGRLAPEKSVKSLEPIWKNIQKECDDVELIVIGNGPEKYRIGNLISKYGKKQIKFMGYVKRNELHGLYQLSDVLLFPSKTEPFGIVVLDALAAGLGVVTSNTVGSSSCFLESQIFRKVAVGDYKGFAKNIVSVLKIDSNLRKKTAHKTIDNWMKEWDAVSGLYDAIKHCGMKDSGPLLPLNNQDEIH